MMCDYNIHFVKNEDGLIQFYSGKDPLRVTGIAKMVQILAKLVLSNFTIGISVGIYQERLKVIQGI